MTTLQLELFIVVLLLFFIIKLNFRKRHKVFFVLATTQGIFHKKMWLDFIPQEGQKFRFGAEHSSTNQITLTVSKNIHWGATEKCFWARFEDLEKLSDHFEEDVLKYNGFE